MYYISSLHQKRSGYVLEREVDQKMKYTQREWDRTVGWGKVPEEYSHTVSTGKTDGENTERSDTHREEDERTLEEGKEYALNDPIWDKRWTQ